MRRWCLNRGHCEWDSFEKGSAGLPADRPPGVLVWQRRCDTASDAQPTASHPHRTRCVGLISKNDLHFRCAAAEQDSAFRARLGDPSGRMRRSRWVSEYQAECDEAKPALQPCATCACGDAGFKECESGDHREASSERPTNRGNPVSPTTRTSPWAVNSTS